MTKYTPTVSILRLYIVSATTCYGPGPAIRDTMEARRAICARVGAQYNAHSAKKGVGKLACGSDAAGGRVGGGIDRYAWHLVVVVVVVDSARMGGMG